VISVACASRRLGLTNRFIIDQHFRQRDRLGRLLTALAYNPFAIGIGLDEDTAAFIAPTRRWKWRVAVASRSSTRPTSATRRWTASPRAAGLHARAANARAGGRCHVQHAHAGGVTRVAVAAEGIGGCASSTVPFTSARRCTPTSGHRLELDLGELERGPPAASVLTSSTDSRRRCRASVSTAVLTASLAASSAACARTRAHGSARARARGDRAAEHRG